MNQTACMFCSICIAFVLQCCGARTRDAEIDKRQIAGGTHEGYFRNDTPDGFGIRRMADGRVISGVWKGEDIVDGSGMILFPDARRRYYGAAKRLQAHGTGRMYWHERCYISGNWSNGKLEGPGESMILLGGKAQWLEGEYRRGRLVQGAGIQIEEDDSLFAGSVVNGVRHGLGFEYDAECNPIRGGIWKQGILVEAHKLGGQEIRER